MIDDVRRTRPGPARPVLAGSAAAFVLLTPAVAGRLAPLLSFDAFVSHRAHTLALAHPAWRSAMAAVMISPTVFLIGYVVPAAVIGICTP
ncbi:hypothetical protein ACWT_3258 [Actinoplanes sp. SE50]|uniref:hypothetical protein n=1 Tax=unclassified Actinoplanes TaxID=2626549 RepID=UPI00023ECB19|nr:MULTISPECIES: hypothetical protein [unclassified Actinoplanes]AEV84281.1 hypothetical protein ACPL_3386 [Actinoplanes sp. SE50/110]ATO82673.1 hypothetical protein ACWT_3258 [Actinoplanes sp. SE50]SLM00080.1 hypothetical protein ACSP50_3312 [Actinoplanes sp. SE50/110]